MVLSIAELVVEEPGTTDDGPAITGWLQRLCRVAVRELAASGAGISLMSPLHDMVTVAVAGPLSGRLEELQFALGEGPSITAFETRRPALCPDLRDLGTGWTAYGDAAQRLGARAVFAFPLQVGAARLGAFDVYRGEPGALSPSAYDRALEFADAALEGLLDLDSEPAGTSTLLADPDHTRFEVYQAQGMVMIQLGVGPTEALVRLRSRAFALDRRLSDVARDVVERRLVLEPDPPPD